MAGRPANPTWTVEPWAPDNNFAAGALPWSGTPTKVAWAGAPSVGITPKTGFPSQAFNYVQNKNATIDQSTKDTLSNLIDYVGQIQVQNWPYLQTTDLGSPRVWCRGDADYDYVNGVWVSVAFNSTVNRLYSSPTGVVWSSAGDFGSAATANGGTVVVDPTNNRYYATTLGQLGDYNGSWTTITTSASRILTTGKWFASKAVFVGSASAVTKISTYTNAAGHVDRTVPGGVTNSSLWASAVGGATLLAVPINTGGAGLVGMTTTDGITWTTATLPTLAGEQVEDVNYGNGVFMLVVTVTSGTTTKIYTSTTGATGSWTLKKTLTGTYVNAIACTGTMWFAAYGLTSSAEPSRGIFSLDNGATWGVCDGFRAALADNVLGRIANNGRQLLARVRTGNNGAAVGSLIVGLPTQT